MSKKKVPFEGHPKIKLREQFWHLCYLLELVGLQVMHFKLQVFPNAMLAVIN